MSVDEKAEQIVNVIVPALRAMVASLLQEQQILVYNHQQLPVSSGSVPIGGSVPVQEFLTVKEAAILLRVKPRTIYDWVSSGYIPHKKIGDRLLFSRTELTNWNPALNSQSRTKKLRAVG
jgi:excisionase family DNA binding protein